LPKDRRLAATRNFPTIAARVTTTRVGLDGTPSVRPPKTEYERRDDVLVSENVLLGWFLGLLFISPFVFFYFLIIKSTDRYEPEPFWLLTVMFFWGAIVSTLTAIIGNELGMAGIAWALNAGPGDELVQASTASFVAPLVEETTKGFGLIVLWALSALWLKEIDGALDGAIYGGVIGLGFTLTEDILYVGMATAKGGLGGFTAVFILRTVMAGLGHASFTAMTGLGIGIAAETRSPIVKVIAPIGGWMCAVGLHFLHNFLVTFLLMEGVGVLLKFLVFWTFDLVFFVLIVVLAVRDRAIVLRGLVDEVGKSLHPKEFERTSSYWMICPGWNLFSLMGSPGGYFKSRRKQLDLIELAFCKHRQRRGEALQSREQKLRARIDEANRGGVFVGAR
jgi:protease PrsW